MCVKKKEGLSMDTNNNLNSAMIGICTECGIAITSNENLGETTPKVRCKGCVEKEKTALEAKKREHEQYVVNSKGRLARSFIYTALADILISGILIFLMPSLAVGIIVAAVLGYMAALQIVWATEPIVSIFDFFLGGPKWAFGFIVELSIDGILWYIAVKIAFWILGIIISIISFIIGALLCMAIGVFSFPFAFYKAIKNPEELEYIF